MIVISNDNIFQWNFTFNKQNSTRFLKKGLSIVTQSGQPVQILGMRRVDDTSEIAIGHSGVAYSLLHGATLVLVVHLKCFTIN